MLKETSGGLEPSEVTEVAVKPMGAPDSVEAVTTTTPEACLLNVALSASAPKRLEKSGMLFISDKVRTSTRSSTNKGKTCVA